MRIGFVSIFAWRPHVEHMHYLASLSRRAGHEPRFLVCDSDLPTCYSRQLHATTPGWLECLKCRAGGLRSYESAQVASIGSQGAAVPLAMGEPFQTLAESSASTLTRMESDADYAAPEFAALASRLAPVTALAYAAAARWIDRERLDALVVFNGRMDATAGVFQAGMDAGLHTVSLERTWFGDGIQLLPNENCLGLKSIDRLMAAWRDVPLSGVQARRAARLAASRFLRRNESEWRAYNLHARDVAWPIADSAHRILLTPGSRNEVRGFPDVEGTWAERTRAFDLLMDRLALDGRDVVLRCHPNWGERIGTATGERAERYYTDWALRRGVHVIASTDKASTLALIGAAEAVVVNGGTAALEAGLLGKQVIATTPSIYQAAGFQTTAYREADFHDVQLHSALAPHEAAQRAADIARQALRFLHTMVFRVPQFVPFVQSTTTTAYRYLAGADPDRLTRLLRTGVLQADDASMAGSDSDEATVLQQIADSDWHGLHAFSDPGASGTVMRIGRRPAFQFIDAVRNRLPRGDR